MPFLKSGYALYKRSVQMLYGEGSLRNIISFSNSNKNTVPMRLVILVVFAALLSIVAVLAVPSSNSNLDLIFADSSTPRFLRADRATNEEEREGLQQFLDLITHAFNHFGSKAAKFIQAIKLRVQGRSAASSFKLYHLESADMASLVKNPDFPLWVKHVSTKIKSKDPMKDIEKTLRDNRYDTAEIIILCQSSKDVDVAKNLQAKLLNSWIEDWCSAPLDVVSFSKSFENLFKFKTLGIIDDDKLLAKLQEKPSQVVSLLQKLVYKDMTIAGADHYREVVLNVWLNKFVTDVKSLESSEFSSFVSSAQIKLLSTILMSGVGVDIKTIKNTLVQDKLALKRLILALQKPKVGIARETIATQPQATLLDWWSKSFVTWVDGHQRDQVHSVIASAEFEELSTFLALVVPVNMEPILSAFQIFDPRELTKELELALTARATFSAAYELLTIRFDLFATEFEKLLKNSENLPMKIVLDRPYMKELSALLSKNDIRQQNIILSALINTFGLKQVTELLKLAEDKSSLKNIATQLRQPLIRFWLEDFENWMTETPNLSLESILSSTKFVEFSTYLGSGVSFKPITDVESNLEQVIKTLERAIISVHDTANYATYVQTRLLNLLLKAITKILEDNNGVASLESFENGRLFQRLISDPAVLIRIKGIVQDNEQFKAIATKLQG